MGVQMIRAVLCIDNAVGEHRRCLLDEEGRPFRLDIERWSERGKHAKLDEIWWGRARARSAGDKGWFVDLGLDDDGLMETSAAITEGALIPARVKSESWADKSVVLSLADMPASTPRPAKPQLHAAPKDDPFLAGVSIASTVTGEDARRSIDAAIEEALSRTVAIPGGGQLTLDATRALTAIDVDAAGRKGGQSLDTDLNLAAADEASRQVALRNIGGLVVIDFVSMKEARDRTAVAERFRAHLADWLGRASKVLEISALGLCEAAIARRARPIADALAAQPEEREALDALRLIESEGRTGPHRVEAVISPQAAAWLERDVIGWQAALADRIGARWIIRAEDRPVGRPKVGPVTGRAL
jgi:hypothetical protein